MDAMDDDFGDDEFDQELMSQYMESHSEYNESVQDTLNMALSANTRKGYRNALRYIKDYFNNFEDFHKYLCHRDGSMLTEDDQPNINVNSRRQAYRWDKYPLRLENIKTSHITNFLEGLKQEDGLQKDVGALGRFRCAIFVENYLMRHIC